MFSVRFTGKSSQRKSGKSSKLKCVPSVLTPRNDIDMNYQRRRVVEETRESNESMYRMQYPSVPASDQAIALGMLIVEAAWYHRERNSGLLDRRITHARPTNIRTRHPRGPSNLRWLLRSADHTLFNAPLGKDGYALAKCSLLSLNMWELEHEMPMLSPLKKSFGTESSPNSSFALDSDAGLSDVIVETESDEEE